ncbi:hypothetical protein Y032_0150g2764 [Ancylostoma ceylanicum]|nr:hypothetical protein Y032_0150g2764 [Ancylostoma ceylanicum]
MGQSQKTATTNFYEMTPDSHETTTSQDQNSLEAAMSSSMEPELPPFSTANRYQSSLATTRIDTIPTISVTELTTKLIITTPRQRRKYQRDNNPDKFLNALIFVLFACVLILVVAIAFTLYFRFIRIDSTPKAQKRPPEAAPLNAPT